MKHSATASLMRKINRSAVLGLIRQQGPLARSEIAHQLNMSLPTVMRIIDDLLAGDLVRWSGSSQIHGGRPSSLVEFNGDGYAVVSMDLGGTKMYGALVDLNGKIQAEATLLTSQGEPEKSLEQVFELIEDLLSRPLSARQVVRGIGVGAPAIVQAKQGIVTWAHSLGWRNLPLKDILSQRFDLPVLVEKDVNLAALGEYGFGAARCASSVVCIAIGTGIGSGIVIDGQIFRGFSQSAGELGHLVTSVEGLGRSYEVLGALEGLASGSGITLQARKLLSELARLPSEGPSADEVFAAARQGEGWARQVVDQAIDHLSLAIGGVCTLLDPEVIVLSGGVARSADLLIEPILQRLEGSVPCRPNLVASQLGSRAAVLGAMLLVQEMVTEPTSWRDWA